MTNSLLPTNATDFELALEEATARIGSVPVPVRDAKYADTTPAAAVAFLGWELGVDVWYRDWPETQKRLAVRRALAMHPKKGTLPALREHLDLVGASVYSYVLPPQKIYSGATLTRDEREAWLAGLPQVRTWRFNERGAAGYGVFLGGYLLAAHMRTRFFVPSAAPERLRRRARWVVGGVETDVKVTQFESYFRVHLPGNIGRSIYSGCITAGRFFVPLGASDRIVTIAPTPVSPWRSFVGPRLDAVTSEPELVTVRGTEGLAVFCGRHVRGRFFLPSTANYRVYERYATSSGASQRARSLRPTVQFMGVGRYGMPRSTAEISVRVRGKRPRWAAGEGNTAPGRMFWRPRDTKSIDRVLDAMRAAKRLSDRIKVSTRTSNSFIAGQPYFAGDRITT